MNFKRNRFIISLVPISRDQSPAPGLLNENNYDRLSADSDFNERFFVPEQGGERVGVEIEFVFVVAGCGRWRRRSRKITQKRIKGK